MTTTHGKIDWQAVRERLERVQTGSGESGRVDRSRLNEVLRQRAQRLARRGRDKSTQQKRVPSIVFRLGNERFGFELAQVKQVFPNVPTTPLPGAGKLMRGVANVNGSLRSIVDLRALVNLPTTQSDDGYIVLLHARGKSLGIWVETLDGVYHIDFDRLTAVEGAVPEATGKLMKGTTDDRILVFDANLLVDYVAEVTTQSANVQQPQDLRRLRPILQVT